MHALHSGLPARIVFFVAACVLAFEEWIWNRTSRLLRRMGRLVPFRWIERWVGRRTPWQAVALYVFPVLVILPLKGVALGLMARGRVASGFEMLLLAKAMGTGVFARLWQLTEPAITTYRWIRRGRDGFLSIRHRLYGWLHRQEAYRRTRALIERIKRQGALLVALRKELGRQRRERALLAAMDGRTSSLH